MSRSAYSHEFDSRESQARYICWRGAVASAIRGARGQAFLRELAKALDAMPKKRLIAGDFVTDAGECCALGSVVVSRGLRRDCVPHPDDAPYMRDEMSKIFGIAWPLIAEIMYENDEFGSSDEHRWLHVRQWVRRNTREPDSGEEGTRHEIP